MTKKPGAAKQTTESQNEMEMRMDQMLRDLCSISQAAEILGVDERHARLLAQQGRITARKIDTIWVVHKPSLNKYLKTKSRRGRPSGARR